VVSDVSAMKIVKIKKIEGCLEGSNVRDVLYDSIVSKEFIMYLGTYGKLIYQDSFDKPFYKVIMKTQAGTFSIKGSEGNRSARLLLPDSNDVEIIEELKRIVIEYN
jgi:hypothetical protein